MRVFIGCVPGDSRNDELVSLLGQYARVSSVMLATDTNPSGMEYCLGYGFAVCDTKDDVQALIALSSKLTYKDRFITLREYKVGSKLKEDKKNFNKRRLFIGNIPRGTTNDQIAEIFSKFGPIENVYFVNTEKEQDYKYGYIVFQEAKTAERALCDTQGIQIGSFKLRVEIFGGKRSYQNNQGSSKGSSNNLSPKKELFPSSLGSFQKSSSNNINSFGSYSDIRFGASERDYPNQNTGFNSILKTREKEADKMIEDTSAWRKALYHRHKTCSLEYQLQHPSPGFNICDKPQSNLNMDIEINKVSTMLSAHATSQWNDLESNVKRRDLKGNPKGDRSLGLIFLSPEQQDGVASNHNLPNVRFNRPNRHQQRI